MMHRLLFLVVLAATACNPAQSADDDRQALGKADLTGSCDSFCGEQSDGACWCDDACDEYGDCCADHAEQCGALACPGDNPAGCRVTGCPEGSTCQELDQEVCAPSWCACDAERGVWACARDCLPPVACLPAEASATCEDRCGGASADASCWCDDACEDYGDCCADVREAC